MYEQVSRTCKHIHKKSFQSDIARIPYDTQCNIFSVDMAMRSFLIKSFLTLASHCQGLPTFRPQAGHKKGKDLWGSSIWKLHKGRKWQHLCGSQHKICFSLLSTPTVSMAKTILPLGKCGHMGQDTTLNRMLSVWLYLVLLPPYPAQY